MRTGFEDQRRRTTQAARPPDTARTVRMRKAHRHRFAHLSSTWRSVAIISLRSSSVFSGIHAGTEPVALVGGSRKGDMRIKAPNIQNGGNTIVKIDQDTFLNANIEKTYRIQIWKGTSRALLAREREECILVEELWTLLSKVVGYRQCFVFGRVDSPGTSKWRECTRSSRPLGPWWCAFHAQTGWHELWLGSKHWQMCAEGWWRLTRVSTLWIVYIWGLGWRLGFRYANTGGGGSCGHPLTRNPDYIPPSPKTNPRRLRLDCSSHRCHGQVK